MTDLMPASAKAETPLGSCDYPAGICADRRWGVLVECPPLRGKTNLLRGGLNFGRGLFLRRDGRPGGSFLAQPANTEQPAHLFLNERENSG
jgi:hypothetical protein